MMINKITNINFREIEQPKEMGSQNPILMLRDPNASVRFQKNQEFAQNADASSTNLFKALGYKLYRTFSMLRDEEPTSIPAPEKRLNTLA